MVGLKCSIPVAKENSNPIDGAYDKVLLPIAVQIAHLMGPIE